MAHWHPLHAEAESLQLTIDALDFPAVLSYLSVSNVQCRQFTVYGKDLEINGVMFSPDGYTVHVTEDSTSESFSTWLRSRS